MTSAYILALLAVLPFLRAINGQFLFDDVGMWEDGPPQVARFREYWWYFFYEDRALVHLFDEWLWRAFGKGGTGKDAAGTEITQPAWPWHALSLAFHVGSTLAVWSMAGWFLEPWRAWVAAAIFAVHPLQVSAVAYISGRAGVQAFFFAALGLIHAHAGAFGFAAVSMYLSFKSKQDGVIYAFVLCPAVLLFAK